MNKSVVILSFSPRKHGNCANISKFISKFHEDQATIIHVNRELVSSCGNCDYECLTPGQHCPAITAEYEAMMDTIINSDLVYFVVPNYCGYPNANYFAFNERSVGYFSLDRQKMKRYLNISKRFIVVSNTEGFEKAMQQQTDSEPKILYLKSGKYKKRSTAGDILDSEEAQQDLMEFLSNLVL